MIANIASVIGINIIDLHMHIVQTLLVLDYTVAGKGRGERGANEGAERA